ncbi:MAG: DUF1697 domain-containing protein [Arenimonas sp.]|nr:DUF1697 domain-containing protein [Rhizobium sp.]MBW8445499.1 DUF1697 domain-containing protein [Arenimonas sp.]
MPVYIALLRAINVGGTGKLPMVELKSLCEDLGFADVLTFIQSGNVIFRESGDAADICARLDAALAERLGKPPGVFLRRSGELAAIAKANPFPAMEPNRVLVSFFAEPVPEDALHGLVAPDGEEVVARGREIFIHYPIGSGRSRLKLPILKTGTARNINTIVKLAAPAAELENRR